MVCALCGSAGAERDKRKKEREKNAKSIVRLKDEMAKQQQNHSAVMDALRKEKDLWLAYVQRRPQTGTEFLQSCLLPRVVLTSSDAIYCAKFVYLLYTLNTPYCNFIHLFNEV